MFEKLFAETISEKIRILKEWGFVARDEIESAEVLALICALAKLFDGEKKADETIPE